MRLSTEAERDEELALRTLVAAVEDGITLFDTARAYGQGANDLGHNERLLAQALRGVDGVRIVTKGGMTRPDGNWVPDGRAKTIVADCNASLEALGGLPIDLWLLHAPDPRTPWRTSIRALARIVEEGLAERVGVCNVTRRQLDEAIDLAPVAAVQCALSIYDDRTLRGGVLERCEETGITFIAHSPLGGPKRARNVSKRPELSKIARTHGATEAEVAIAWLLALSPSVVPIPGARRPETVHSVARAAQLELTADERAHISGASGVSRPSRRKEDASTNEVLVIMGIPGAGKSRLAAGHAAQGFVRLNRDERGGTLRDVARALDETLERGGASVLLDNTYLTRASRSHVIDAAHRHGARARCIWLDTPSAQAQINLIERLLDAHGSLAGPDELKALAKSNEGILAPTSQLRTVRELEPPTLDEGWSEIERVPFVRDPRDGGTAVFVAAAAAEAATDALRTTEPDAPHLVFAWHPDGSTVELVAASQRVRDVVTGPVSSALCPHPGGPPRCWCRPPLPGLVLQFAREHGIDPARSVLLGSSPAHRTLATALGATYIGS